jgi:hypothetical protein
MARLLRNHHGFWLFVKKDQRERRLIMPGNLDTPAEAEMERLMQAFQRLRDAPEGSPDAERRQAIEAQIRMLDHSKGDDMSKGRPQHTETEHIEVASTGKGKR